jgi:hypothetical protein
MLPQRGVLGYDDAHGRRRPDSCGRGARLGRSA